MDVFLVFLVHLGRICTIFGLEKFSYCISGDTGSGGPYNCHHLSPHLRRPCLHNICLSVFVIFATYKVSFKNLLFTMDTNMSIKSVWHAAWKKTMNTNRIFYCHFQSSFTFHKNLTVFLCVCLFWIHKDLARQMMPTVGHC